MVDVKLKVFANESVYKQAIESAGNVQDSSF